MIGWVGSILLALCGLPEAVNAIRTGNSALTYMFLLMWLFGEIFTLIYAVKKSKETSLLPLIFNYGLNIIFISVILLIKIYGELHGI